MSKGRNRLQSIRLDYAFSARISVLDGVGNVRTCNRAQKIYLGKESNGTAENERRPSSELQPRGS
jgi:hypothetical protein